MPLFEMKSDNISPLSETTFAAAAIKERGDLQRLLREQIEVIAPDTMVVAEEFGDWEDSKRRIDLLGLDRSANLVVIELKRTDDGGHLELQAIRYAAMVSTMTFDQVAEAHAEYLRRLGRADDARAAILAFLGWDEPDEEHFAQGVRIVLASADFSREITTAVMWLNERDLDIRCIRLRPYNHADSLILDVQQVIPLPEASEYQVRVRAKLQRERDARLTSGNRDYTRFTVTTNQGTRGQLPKRRAILEVVKGLIAAGAPLNEVRRTIEPRHRFRERTLLSTPGRLDSQDYLMAAAAESQASGRAFDLTRYFCADADLIHADGRTCALTNQWGTGTAETIERLIEAFPYRGVACVPDEAEL